MSWTKLRLRVETPLFSGDGDPTSAQVRVSSIRGGMHFWLRAMAGILAGDEPRLLRKIEDKVLGSTRGASPIKLRIRTQPTSERESYPDFLVDRYYGRSIGYLLGPGLVSWSAKDKAIQLNRAFVPVGQEFELLVRLEGKDHDAHRCALAALWLSLTYGGIGARTRRGFGRVRIIDVEGPIPQRGWLKEPLLTPTLDHYVRTKYLWPSSGPAGEAMPALLRIAKDREIDGMHEWEGIPTYPVLSKQHTVASTNGGPVFTSWLEALGFAGEELRYFRAEIDHEEKVPYYPPVKTDGWVNVVKKDEVELPMAALGLPLIYDKEFEVHASTRDENSEKLRRASPLWIRAVGEGESWRVFSFSFLDRFLPEQDTNVNLWKDQALGKEVDVTTGHAHALSKEWIDTLARDETFVRDDPAWCR